MRYRYISSPSTDPRWNLALEEYVFDSLPRDKSYFMLWRNHNTIVVGKNQNTAAEINGQFVRSNDITVVRRLSGGGTVYHDLGNLNFTFITDAADAAEIDFRRFCLPIVDALADLGVKAEINGRNDITIAGKKFSGNSQYLRDGRAMHHGTLMFRSDLTVLSRALAVDREKLSAKGIPSVVSRVTNIGDHLPPEVTIDDLRDALLQHIPCEDNAAPYVLTEADIAAINKIAQERYASWEWTYGQSQALQRREKQRIEDCGTIDVALSSDGGIITALEIHGDFFGSGDVAELSAALVGCRCEKEALKERLDTLHLQHYIHNCPQEALIELLLP